MSLVEATGRGGFSFKVIRLKLQDTTPLKPLVRGTVVTLVTDETCTWWLAMHGGEVIGAVCAKQLGRDKWRMKSDIVIPEHQNKGVYHILSGLREGWCREQGAKELNCFSSKYSRGTFERAGYEIVGDPDKANVYMRKVIEEG